MYFLIVRYRIFLKIFQVKKRYRLIMQEKYESWGVSKSMPILLSWMFWYVKKVDKSEQ